MQLKPKYERSIALRKTLRHNGLIEQYTETLPRRWWQLRAATRVRVRRITPAAETVTRTAL